VGTILGYAILTSQLISALLKFSYLVNQMIKKNEKED
jgi:hypothetical protein